MSPRLLIAAAVAALSLAAPAAEEPSPAARVVVFKYGRTGSTWMSELLEQQPAVAFFEHEAQGCLKGQGSLANYQAMQTMVAAPACDMACPMFSEAPAIPEWPAWVRPVVPAPIPARPGPRCLAGKLVGFDVEPWHEFDALPGQPTTLRWDAHWAPLLRLPGVTTVVYARSNLVKTFVAKKHGNVLKKLCAGTHKVVDNKSRRCYEQHQKELARPVAVKGHEIEKEARVIGRRWVRMLENARNASGRARFPVVYYEGLQKDPRAELGRLFSHLGLPAPAKIKASAAANVKITSDDLRDSVVDFSQVEGDLARSPCLAEQLRAAKFEIFPALCLEGDPHLKDLRGEFPHL
eukprot:CAMPEP_0119294360 /NCGR_PEP_ID=MMETSP1329-20130426/47846_1 /TAXON_ID=114041 /ORGANISM="Genus nov. species nov., Strain RCC1024" /LENGTH=348 /DNA_ID=CAMNT_0007295247 /DNA_START=250 /DNA_END=1292 /DNA_ORIENTATION=+